MSSIINSYQHLINRLNDVVRMLKAHPKILSDEKHKELYPAYRKAMYIAISSSDLIIGLKNLDRSAIERNEIDANYFARHIVLVCYELINHQQKVLDKNVGLLFKLALEENDFKEYKSFKTELKDIKNEHFDSLKYIRNNLIAHRAADGLEMANGMLSIDNKKIYKIGKSVFDAYFKLIGFYVAAIGKL